MNFDQPFFKRNFIGQEYIVNDKSTNSPYIDFPDMPTYIGGGVSIVKFYPSTVNLHTLAPLEAEVLDANGDAVRTEIADFRDRFGNYYLSIYTNDNTAEGYGSISFVGVANATLDGEYIEPDQVNRQGFNLIITKPLLIQPFERNSSPLVFDTPPLVEVGQIVAPARMTTATVDRNQADSLQIRYTASFITANVEGFDKVAATSTQIQDSAIRDFAVKNLGGTSTVNQVPTVIRQEDYDVENGQLIGDTNRFRTIIQLQSGSLTSNFKGAKVTLNKYNTYSNVTRSLGSTTVFAKTNPYNELLIQGQTQSLSTQLNQYVGTIVRVLTTSSCIVDLPLQVNIDSYSTARKNPITRTTTHTFRSAKDIKTLITYQNPTALVVSNNVSQSYLQFTFQNLKPIGGSVYRIKSFYRQNSLTGDYKLLNDQRVKTTEYLTEANTLNRLFYAKEISPFLMIGHFDQANVVSAYWKGYSETATTIDTLAIARNTNVLIDSVRIPVTNPAATSIFTTTGYQIYQQDQVFSISFICVLEPNTTLEIYANSKILSTQLYDASPFAQAFETSKNVEKTRYSANDNRFGKYVGKITNNSNERKDYGRVVFDIDANYDGYGRPLFRVKSTDQTNTATAYLSEISVAPRQQNGYTPEIYQYAINAPDGFEQLISESVDFKFEYYDYTGQQSEYVTYLNGINLALQSEVQSNVCQVENYKFSFNPTLWSIVTESATYRNTFVAPYFGASLTIGEAVIVGTASAAYPIPLHGSNPDNPSGYKSHSFAQVGASSPHFPFTSTATTDYFQRGWSRTDATTLRTSLTGSSLSTQTQRRRYFPAYDQMHAQISFYDAYSAPLFSSESSTYVPFRLYSYGVGSTYNGPNSALHTWSGWNALRPWKPIFAHKWLNKTSTDTSQYGGRFVYTSSWEIFPALGQGVYLNPSFGNKPQLRATSAVTPGARRSPIVKAAVTASWKFFDEFSENYFQVSGGAMLHDFNPSAWAAHTASYNRCVISASYRPQPGNELGTSSIDLNFPVNSGAAGITRFDVSQSYVTTSGVGFTTAQKAVAYKQRRFYFPQGGPLTGSVFTENGGIYNVKFRLKRYQSGSNSQNWFVPDTGSYLMVYLFDVSAPYTTQNEGVAGYYPPPQNIVKIGNQVTTNGYNIPAIQFYDSVTGYLYDEYEINLIQYGSPAQLVFEPSGDSNRYFGCAIDSVEFCKIGTTTDPYYIKPPADDTI